MADQPLNSQLVATVHLDDLGLDRAFADEVVVGCQVGQVEVVGEQGRGAVGLVGRAKFLNALEGTRRPLAGGAREDLQALGPQRAGALEGLAELASRRDVGADLQSLPALLEAWVLLVCIAADSRRSSQNPLSPTCGRQRKPAGAGEPSDR